MKIKTSVQFYCSLVILCMALTSCAAYMVHPGAVNKSDSVAYDTLLVAGAVIDQAKVEITAGKLPATLKPAFNRLVVSYNTARNVWLTYRTAVKAGNRVDDTTLKSAIDTLNTVLDAFQGSRRIP